MLKKRNKQLNQRRRHRLVLILLFLQMQKVNRQWWVHPINLLRKEKGEFYQLYPDLRHFPKKFCGMYRMSIEKFTELLQLVTPKIIKKMTYLREAISPGQKLVLTLT